MTTIEQQSEVSQLLNMLSYASQRLGQLGVPAPDATTREGMLQSELSETSLREQLIGRILKFTGPMRDLPAHAQAIMNRLG